MALSKFVTPELLPANWKLMLLTRPNSGPLMDGLVCNTTAPEPVEEFPSMVAVPVTAGNVIAPPPVDVAASVVVPLLDPCNATIPVENVLPLKEWIKPDPEFVSEISSPVVRLLSAAFPRIS